MSDAAKPAAAPKPAAMRFDLPTPQADTQPFWNAARRSISDDVTIPVFRPAK